MLKIKKDYIYSSKLLLKFINTLIFLSFKRKIEKLVNFSFYYWKKQLNNIPIFYFFEAILKLRPVMGFYIFIITKKKKKKSKNKTTFYEFLITLTKSNLFNHSFHKIR
jgi:ribosomal protein S7